MKVRIYPFYVLIILSFLIIWLRLFYLQIVKGNENLELADNNRIKIIPIVAPRGVILDRNNQVLVRNRPEGREYIYGEALAHVLGFISEVNEADLGSGYKIGDLIGKLGLEQTYDKMLRGQDGGVLVETNASGQAIREIKKTQPITGNNINTTLDLGLQKKTFEVLKNRKGAVIVSNPNNGEILALVSSPSFNPNVLTFNALPSPDPLRQKNIAKIFNDSNQPLFNRVISGLYPPGSTFKIVTAIAGLESGKIDSETKVEDTGEIKVGAFSFGNWYFRQYGKTEGQLDLLKAIQRSNDIYFYKVGEWVGITKIFEWAKYFGLNQVLGIDISGEASGLLPTPEWKKQTKMEDWYLGDTYITAIGQGDLLLTPLQVNHMVSVVAAMGKSCPPHLLKESKENCMPLNIKPQNLALIKEGMKLACSEGGTGWPFFNFVPQVGCKTGTAEFGPTGVKTLKTHAWFSAFAPWDKPEIVVTVLLEGAGEGSTEAGPVAKEILSYWFKDREGK